MRNILFNLVEKITGEPRHCPDIEWDKRIWIANVFRAWEYLAGRRYGIRKEASSSVYFKDGRKIVSYEFYTAEAFLAHIEGAIRDYIAETIAIFKAPDFNYQLGAIALDTSTKSTEQGSSPITHNHTCTGTDRLIAICPGLYSRQTSYTTASAASYAASAATKARGDQNNTGGLNRNESSIWLKSAPSTGSNQVSVSFTGGVLEDGCVTSVSYTGVSQTSTADAVGGNTGTATGSRSLTVTTIANNCWVIAVGMNGALADPTMTANQTLRQTLNLGSTSPTVVTLEDLNGPKTPAGAQVMSFTIGGVTEQNWVMTGASIAPSVAGLPPGKIIQLKQAVNRSYTY